MILAKNKFNKVHDCLCFRFSPKIAGVNHLIAIFRNKKEDVGQCNEFKYIK